MPKMSLVNTVVISIELMKLKFIFLVALSSSSFDINRTGFFTLYKSPVYHQFIIVRCLWSAHYAQVFKSSRPVINQLIKFCRNFGKIFSKMFLTK